MIPQALSQYDACQNTFTWLVRPINTCGMEWHCHKRVRDLPWASLVQPESNAWTTV